MSDINGELSDEILKAMQARLGNIEFDVHELKTEMSALHGHVIAIKTDINSIHPKSLITTHGLIGCTSGLNWKI